MSPTEQLEEIMRRLKLLEAEAARDVAAGSSSPYVVGRKEGIFAAYSAALNTIREVMSE